MSKIYEALLRAEQERFAGQTTAPAQATVEALPETLNPGADASPAAAAVWAPVEPFSPTPDERADATAAPPALSPPPFVQPPTARGYEAPFAEAASLPSDPARLVSATPHTHASAFDAAHIPVVEWKPLYEKLPALELRGGPVEQFRSLRSRLFAFRDMNKLKTVMITSGLPREGKSFVAGNLAVSFARHKNSRVLLIDGDMRRSSLHTLLGCASKPGLATYLAGTATAQGVMQRGRAAAGAVRLRLPSGLEQLTFIAGGDEGDKAADLSGSARFAELLAEAEKEFDWIIVDSPPVNLVTDGINLAHSCDGVLLVVRQGVTPFPVAQRAMSELKASRMLGVVLNAATVVAGSEGYYGYDGYDSKTQPLDAGERESAGA